jgi:hypothetical protein
LSGLLCRSHLLCPRTFLIPHASSTCWQGSTGKQRGAITVPGYHPIDVHVSSPVCVMEGVASFRGKPSCHFLFLGEKEEILLGQATQGWRRLGQRPQNRQPSTFHAGAHLDTERVQAILFPVRSHLGACVSMARSKATIEQEK